MSRKPSRKGRISPQHRQAALNALASIVEKENVADYVKAKAAATLISADKPDPEDNLDHDPDAPITYTILPDNQRNPQVRYGLHSPGQRIVIVPVHAGFPLEVRPESFYADVPKPAGRVAEREAAKERVAEAMAADPERFRADCDVCQIPASARAVSGTWQPLPRSRRASGSATYSGTGSPRPEARRAAGRTGGGCSAAQCTRRHYAAACRA